MDFELSNGRAFVRLSELPARQTLVNFWRADCPPCLKELPELARVASEGKVNVVLVAVQKPAETEAMPASRRQWLRPPAILVHAPSSPWGLLGRFGNSVGALPHSAWLSPTRKICAVRTGMIDEAWIKASDQACAP